MKILLSSHPLAAVALCVLGVACLVGLWSRGFTHARPASPVGALHLVNIGEGTHEHPALFTDAAIATRHLLVKIGSDANHVAVAAANDCPIGNVPDEPSGAEELVEVNRLGNGKPRLMIASEAIAADVDVFTAAGGKVQDEPAVAGTYYKVGRTRAAAAADGAKVEVMACSPVKLVVIAALTAPTTADGSDLATTQALANAIKADLAALDGALASPAVLKII